MDVTDFFLVNVTQYLEVEAEAEHQRGVGSQPREWGTVETHIHIITGLTLL